MFDIDVTDEWEEIPKIYYFERERITKNVV